MYCSDNLHFQCLTQLIQEYTPRGPFRDPSGVKRSPWGIFLDQLS